MDNRWVNRRTRARLLGSVRALPGVRRYPVRYVSSALAARGFRADFANVRSFLIFIGHPRSGHSLIGALLDAHPNMLVAHELDVLKYVDAGFRRDQLFVQLVRQEQARVAQGHASSTGYTYAVPDQWQGRYERLEIIGDKKGGRSTTRLRERPDLLDKLSRTVDMPVKVIQVVRDPYDNIATMYRRAPRLPLAHHVESYFIGAATADTVRKRLSPDDFHAVHLDDVVAEPTAAVAGLCSFLGVHANSGYLKACASIVFPMPRHTRDGAPWTPDLLDRVAAGLDDHPLLARYRAGDRPVATPPPGSR